MSLKISVFRDGDAGMEWRRGPSGSDEEDLSVNRVVGIGTSLVLIAAGAVMAFAVSVQTNGFNVNTVGWILMGVGLLGLIVALIVAMAGTGASGATYVDRGTTVVEREPVRERIVERDRF